MSIRYEYKVAYVVAWEQISIEGVETGREHGERNSSFGRRVLNELGADGWELVALHPTLERPQAAYYTFRRPLAEGAEPDLSIVRRQQEQPAETPTPSQAPIAPAAGDIISL